MDFSKMTANELIKAIDNTDVTNDSFKRNFHGVLELMQVVSEHEEYCEKFNEMWKPCYTAWDKVNANLKHICGGIWMTDCDEIRAEFPNYFYNSGYDLDKTFLSADIMINRSEYNEDLQKIMEIFFGEPYDNDGDDDAYWRLDSIHKEDMQDYLTLLIKADKMIDTYISLY